MSLRERIQTMAANTESSPVQTEFYQLRNWIRVRINTYLREGQFDGEVLKFVTEVFPDIKEAEVESFLHRVWPAINAGHLILCGYDDTYGNYIGTNLKTCRIKKSLVSQEVNYDELA